MYPKGKTILSTGKIIGCYTSADKSIYALFVDDSDFRFYVMSTKDDRILFDSKQDEGFKHVKFNFQLEEHFDFSPNNKKFMLHYNGQLLVYDLDRRLLTTHELEIDKKLEDPVNYVRFLDEEKIVCLMPTSVCVVEEGKRTTSNIIDGNLDDMHRLYFLNRKDKNILCFAFNENLNDADLVETKLLGLDGKLMSGPRIDCIKNGMLFDFSMNLHAVMFLGHNPNDFALVDFSSYIVDGTVMYGQTLEYRWKVFGVPCITLDVASILGLRIRINKKDYFSYLYHTDSKIFTYESVGVFHDELRAITKQELASEKLAHIAGRGLNVRGSFWNKFLMRGLYDPRLLLIVWNFIGE